MPNYGAKLVKMPVCGRDAQTNSACMRWRKEYDMELKFTKPSNGEIQSLITGGLEGVEGVSNTAVKNIAASVLNLWESRIADYKADTKIALDAAQKEIDTVMQQYGDAYENDESTWKVKYDTEVTAHGETKTALEIEKAAHATTKSDYDNKEKNATIDKLYTELLTTSGFDPALIDNEMKLVNRESLTLDKDGKLKDSDKVLADTKGRWPEGAFGTTTEQTAKTFAGGSFARGQGGANPFAAETRNLEQQAKIMREDPERARRLAGAVGTQLPNF